MVDLNSICQPDIIDILWSSSSKRKLNVLPQCYMEFSPKQTILWTINILKKCKGTEIICLLLDSSKTKLKINNRMIYETV